MYTNDPETLDRIARELGHPSFAEAPPVVRNAIAHSLADGPVTVADDGLAVLLDRVASATGDQP